MPFQPNGCDEITLKGKSFIFVEDPSEKNRPARQTGSQASVYQLKAHDGSLHALKVFLPAFRSRQTLDAVKVLNPLADLQGMRACRRIVLAEPQDASLLTTHPDLSYAILMPWMDGQTWQSVMQKKRALPQDECLAMARSLVTTLSGLEAQGVAHCQLESSNVLVKTDGDALSTQASRVTLVDLEGLYAPGLARPANLQPVFPGYGNPRDQENHWDPTADRFAGAILIAEMLGWCDDRIVKAASGAAFFDPQEIQQDCSRYKLMVEVLRTRFGEPVSQAFTKAWFSKEAGDCPALTAWREALGAPAAQPVPFLAQPPAAQIKESEPSLAAGLKSFRMGALPSVLSWVLAAVMLIAVVVLGVLLAQSQKDLGRTQTLLSRVESTVEAQSSDLKNARAQVNTQATQIASIQGDLDDANSLNDELSSDLANVRSDLSDANQQISSLKSTQPVRLTIYNNYSEPQYISLDGIAFIYIPSHQSASFYIKPGYYHLKSCHPSRMSNWSGCADWGNYTIKSDYTLTIRG